MKRSFYTKDTNHYKMHKKVQRKDSGVTWEDPRCGAWIDNPRNLTYNDDKVTCLSCIRYTKYDNNLH